MCDLPYGVFCAICNQLIVPADDWTILVRANDTAAYIHSKCHKLDLANLECVGNGLGRSRLPE